MARKKQQLINYHTGGLTSQPLTGDVQFGEIVVRHNYEKPELLIKVNSGTTGESGYGEWFENFMSAKDVETAIAAAITTSEGGIESTISTIQNNLSAFSATVVNNYWTSAETQAQIGAASGYSLEQAKNYADSQDDALSGRIITHVQTAITDSITGNVQALQQKVTNLETFSGYVETHYATSADTEEAIEAAKIEAEIASSAYTDSQIQMLSAITSAYVADSITAVTGDISDLTSRVSDLEAFSGLVETDYATKEEVATAKLEAVDSAYTNAKSDLIGESTDASNADTIWGAKNYAKELSGNVVTYVEGEVSTLNSNISDVDDKVDELSGSVVSMSGDIKTYIDNELSTVYTYQGSVATYADLPANAEVGDVYNVVAANGNPGEAGYTPAGTNYAWVGESSEGAGDGHWDALGGVVDLSNYTTTATTSALSGRVSDLESASSDLSGDLKELSGAVETLSGKVVSDYATSADTVAAIQNAKDEAVTSAYTASMGYTDEQIAALSGIASSYTNTEISNLENRIETTLQNYAYSSITHNEIEEAKATIIGSAVTTSADPETITGLKLYSDEKDRELEADFNNKFASLSGAAIGDLSALSGTVVNLSSTVNTHGEKITNLENSAATWNNAIQGAEFGAVTSSDAHFDGGEGSGATYDSNAKLSYTEGGNITLDLSELIIDCGDF